jgi:hypothetical protein
MRALILLLVACGKGDCPKDPDCADAACAAVCDADGDGAIAQSAGGDDCDDGDAAIHPGAPEVCGGADDDCDGLVDDDDPDVAEPPSWYLDDDGDGFGAGEPIQACEVSGRVQADGDCDDGKPDVYPGAPEACDDAEDNDCDGARDGNERDDDEDGTTLCAGDCDDADPAIHPAAVEICNDGVDDDCDGLVELDDPSANLWTCDYCPPWDGWNTSPITVTTYNPCVIDPLASWGCSTDPLDPDTHENGVRLHRVAYRPDIEHYRPQLLLWFPPGPGNFNTKVLKMAAWAGYRSILIGYPNENLNNWGQNCTSDLGDCYANGRQEILWGDDTSEYIDIPWSDSAVGRVVELLAYLDAENPGEGWADYIAPTGDDLIWEDTVVMGWSEGGTNLGWLVHEVEPHGAFFLSSPEDALFDVGQDLASFYYTPFATPGCAIYAAYHAQEPNVPFKLSLDQMGVPGDLTLIDDLDPPFGGTHRYTTYLTEFTWDDCTYHEAMGFDPCMSGLLGEAYVHTLCELGDLDREVECPWVP